MPPKADSASASRARDVGLGDVAAGGRAARVGVLDDGRRRLVELEHDARRRVEVEQVRERQLLALQDRRPRRSPCAGSTRVPGRRLVRVLAVAQVAEPRQVASTGRPASAGGSAAPRRTRSPSVPMVSSVDGDRGVVGGRCGRTPSGPARSGTRASARRARSSASSTAGSRPGRRPPARRGSSWPPRAPCSGRRCRSPRSAPSNGVRRVGGRARERVEVDDDEVDRARCRARRAPPGRPARSRRARMPPWTAGCSVLTRPSIISGKPVTSETLTTGRPASASALAVPPVETRARSRGRQAAAKGTRPVLSDTLSSARAS